MFTGRNSYLDSLAQLFQNNSIIILNGLGGIGKTQIAIEYIFRHQNNYGAIFWIRASTVAEINIDFASVAKNLNLPEKESTNIEDIRYAVKNWLENNNNWFLVMDNLDDISTITSYLPTLINGKVLITTNLQPLGEYISLEITKMNVEEAALFLLYRAKILKKENGEYLENALQKERNLAVNIVNEMDALPLAIDQAGAYIAEARISLDKYLDIYKQEGRRLRELRGTAMDHPSLTTTFSLACKKIKPFGYAPTQLIYFCSLLDSYKIPIEIFLLGRKKLGKHLSAKASSEHQLLTTIRQAGNFSLIKFNPNNSIDMHRLVQAVVKDIMKPIDLKSWRERVILVMNEVFPLPEFSNWDLCEKLLPHALIIAEIISTINSKTIEAAMLLHNIALYFQDRGQYVEAEQFFNNTISLQESMEHSDVRILAITLNNKAGLYQELGRDNEADELLLRSLNLVRSHKYDSYGVDLIKAYSNIASSFVNKNKSEEAIKLYLIILNKAQEFNLGTDTIGPILYNLAVNYKNAGDVDHALHYFTKVKILLEETLNDLDPNLAEVYTGLGAFWIDQQDYIKAEEYLTKSLNIRTKLYSYNEDHPQIAEVLYYFMELYFAQARLNDAIVIGERIIAIFMNCYRQTHPRVLDTLNGLSILYQQTSQHRKAEAVCNKMLTIYQSVLNNDNPAIIELINRIRNLRQLMGDAYEQV